MRDRKSKKNGKFVKRKRKKVIFDPKFARSKRKSTLSALSALPVNELESVDIDEIMPSCIVLGGENEKP